MYRRLRQTWMIVMLAILSVVFISCGSGGGGGDGGGGAVSGHVPYLLSEPSVSFVANSINNAQYDVTVTVEADGPTGVFSASVWIIDESDENSIPIDLSHIPSTKKWSGTTNTFIPLPAGKYYVNSIVLNDGDPITADPLRTGWYMVMPVFSNDKYYVDERELSGLSFINYNSGLSDIRIARFTLP